MIEKSDRDILIEYRLNQAEQTIDEVTKLIETELYNIAVNRIYYGMFYCLTALALKFEFSSSKHAQLIGWFNQSFIKTQKIEVQYGKILRNAYNTNCTLKCRMAILKFTIACPELFSGVNADATTKE